jgi:hypothetical protein
MGALIWSRLSILRTFTGALSAAPDASPQRTVILTANPGTPSHVVITQGFAEYLKRKRI